MWRSAKAQFKAYEEVQFGTREALEGVQLHSSAGRLEPGFDLADHVDRVGE
jgi:hypothetical protein